MQRTARCGGALRACGRALSGGARSAPALQVRAATPAPRWRRADAPRAQCEVETVSAGGATVATARVRLPVNAAGDALRPQAMQRAAQVRAPTRCLRHPPAAARI